MTPSEIQNLIFPRLDPLRVPIAASGLALLTATAFGWAYFDLNIRQSLFLTSLGCGCKPHYNTNDLTLCIGWLLTIPVGAVAGFSARNLARTLRWCFLGISSVVLAYWFVKFCYFNWWL
jgi:hypothetical protein